MASKDKWLYDSDYLDWFRIATTADIDNLSNKLDEHELKKINSENGLHGVRIWLGKIEEKNENDEWVEIGIIGSGGEIVIEDASLTEKGITLLSNAIDSTDEDKASTPLAVSSALEESKIYSDENLILANQYTDIESLQSLNRAKEYVDNIVANLETTPLEHTHTTDEIEGLDTYIADAIINASTGEITLSDASLTVKGVVQLSNDIDSDDETKAVTPKAIKDGLTESKSYTDDKTVETLTNANQYTDNKSTETLQLANEYSDTKIDELKVESDDKYSEKVHTHTIPDVANLQSELNNKSPLIHKHEISDVNDLQSSLDNKAPLADFNALKTQFTGHKHTIADVDLLQTSLDSKAPLNHNHQWSQITGRPTTSPSQIDAMADSIHSHPNIDVLNLFEDGNGTLIYNGNPLGEVAYLSVQTIADRDAIPLEARKEGLMVMVLEDGGMYYLKNGVDNAFWEIFATGSGGATNASTLPATPSGTLTGVNTQSILDELESKKADKSDVYSKAETENFMKGYVFDYSTLDNLPDLSTLHGHENKETLDLFSQFQGNLTWKGKTIGDLVAEAYDANLDGVIDIAQKLVGVNATPEEINALSGVTGNVQSQLEALKSGVTFKGEFANYGEMVASLPTPVKGDLVYVKEDENKDGALDTQYVHDGVEWVYGGGTTKVPDATLTTKGIIQLGGDLSHPSSTASAPKLNATGVTSGLYKNANITVDESGRITHAEEGNVVFLNDTITSTDEGWSSQKISDELGKKAERNHTHEQLHDSTQIGSVKINDITPNDKQIITYNQSSGQAEWMDNQGTKVFVGSKFVEGSYTLIGGSYITLGIDEISKTITINGTYRESGGNIIPTGYIINASTSCPASSSVRFSVPATYNKFMLHTVQAYSSNNSTIEVRIYNQSPSEEFGGYVEYNSNPELQISDIVNIPIFDYDNSKMVHLEVVNLGIEDTDVTIRLKCTNLL